MRFRLVPVDEKFFELFSQAAANGAACARRLRDQLKAAEGARRAAWSSASGWATN